MVAARDHLNGFSPRDQLTQTEANGTQATEPQAGKPTRDGARETGPALALHYRFILWLVPTHLDRFPRAQRFLLGDRIQRTALDVLDLRSANRNRNSAGNRNNN